MTRPCRICALALVALAACGERGPLEEPRTHPDQARIVCDEEGTTLETPVVAARADGVHLLVINRLSTDPGFAFEHEGGGGGRNTHPGGTREYVEPIPPGEARVGCWTHAGPEEIGEPDMKKLTIVDPEGHYVPAELGCTEVVSGVGDPPPPTGTGTEGLPGYVRERFAGQVLDSDVVELAGYRRGGNHAVVSVVREGRVVAVVEFLKDGEQWFDDGYSACDDF